ncbi:MAG: ABC transporter permease [Candidatus Thorarchaeota archaeon]
MTESDTIQSSTEREEAHTWVMYLAYFTIVLGFINVIAGFLNLINSYILFASGTFNLFEMLVAIATGSASAIAIGILLLPIALGVRDLENWAFPWVLYGNLLAILLFLASGGFMPFVALFNLLAIIILMTPQVRASWWGLFIEDMGPRAKETRYTLYLIRKSPLVVAGIVIIGVYISLTFLAPFITPYGPTERNWYETLRPPSETHIWGTDQNGGDVYSMVIWATQVDLKIALSVVAVALVIGAFLGAAAGYFGGAVDEILMRITDVFFAFPGLILAMAIVSALGARNLDNISIALMLVWWPTYARLVRGQVLIEREKLYVEAARSVGASDARILAFHILPNTIQPVIVQATLDMGGVLLTAAGLSFIGFGAEAGSAEWGLMIAQGQTHFAQYWVTLYPGLAILFCALSFNLVGDGVRDILDPKLRRR